MERHEKPNLIGLKLVLGTVEVDLFQLKKVAKILTKPSCLIVDNARKGIFQPKIDHSQQMGTFMKTLLQAAVLAVASLIAVSTLAADAKKDWPASLTFGVVPLESATNMSERYNDLVEYLSTNLGIKVELKVANDYAAVITAMKSKHVDLVYFGPKSYVEAAKRADAEAFVLEIAEDGTKGYYGIIITKKDSGLTKLEDLKGKKWAFTDPNSTSGTLVPMVYFMKELKIDPKTYFGEVIYSGNHAASILSVRNGTVDGASTNDLDFARGEGKQWKKEEFNTLWTSALIPGAPMAYRKDLPESLKTALKDAFLNYKDEKGLTKMKIQGYAPADDKLYDSIRELNKVKKQLQNK